MEDQTLTHSVWLRTRPLDSECWTSHCIAYFYLSPSDLLSLHYLFHSISPSPYPIFTRILIPEGSKVLPVDPYLLGYSSSHIPREQVKVVCYSEKGERHSCAKHMKTHCTSRPVYTINLEGMTETDTAVRVVERTNEEFSIEPTQAVRK